jgi:NAD(P)-dependent dehydrogenase (short-subunit alcohol dehydrogenase family)
VLRPGLLDGVSVLVVGCSAGVGVGDGVGDASTAGLAERTLGAEVQRTCAALGGVLAACAAPTADADAERAEDEIDAAIAVALEAVGGRAEAVVIDADGLFADSRAAGEALRMCMLACWASVRSVARSSFIGEGARNGGAEGGRIVLIAPRSDGRAHAAAATAGLENLARTLSIEWARYATTAVVLAPGADTPASEVAAVTAYLLSPAGAYFSGCVLDLRGEPAHER